MRAGWMVGWVVGVVLVIGDVSIARRGAAADQPRADQPGAEQPRVEQARVEQARQWLSDHYDTYATLYQSLHAAPELSFHERQTAQTLAELWKNAGYEVTTGVGGHGIVGLLANGDGPMVMLRTDLDALPVTETTPVPYASRVTAIGEDGNQTGVMHACGHDVHMTNLTAVATYLATHRDVWRGTVMLIGQPAEEKGAGSAAMLADGLFARFGKPDFALAMHVTGDSVAGTVSVRSGPTLANVDSVDITIRGRGGHGSAPHTTIDPIVMAADLVMSLQTLVSREISPIDPAVITVGSIHGGTKHNIIGNDCKLQLTVRSYTDEVRGKLLSGIRRKAAAVAQSYGADPPELLFSEGTPSLNNDPELAARMKQRFIELLGEANVIDDEPSMGGEDFSRYGIAGVPILMYRVGSVGPQRMKRFEELGVPPPSLHSSQYYPDLDIALPTAFALMITATLDLLDQP